jgi:hypothetical protein
MTHSAHTWMYRQMCTHTQCTYYSMLIPIVDEANIPNHTTAIQKSTIKWLHRIHVVHSYTANSERTHSTGMHVCIYTYMYAAYHTSKLHCWFLWRWLLPFAIQISSRYSIQYTGCRVASQSREADCIFGNHVCHETVVTGDANSQTSCPFFTKQNPEHVSMPLVYATYSKLHYGAEFVHGVSLKHRCHNFPIGLGHHPQHPVVMQCLMQFTNATGLFMHGNVYVVVRDLTLHTYMHD